MVQPHTTSKIREIIYYTIFRISGYAVERKGYLPPYILVLKRKSTGNKTFLWGIFFSGTIEVTFFKIVKRSFGVKENHSGPVVSEISRYTD